LPIRERTSPNDASRDGARIDMLVLHYTGMTSAEAALARLCDPAARVSAHYLIEEDGAIWHLVPEARRAFHAGVSCWHGEFDLNRVSLGIEIVNPGHEWGYRPFPEPQMIAVERLCRDILARHPIPPDRVVGHSDIAPDRKADPGELFDWPRLARAGIGLWPPPATGSRPRRGRGVGIVERAAALSALARIGYCVTAGSEAVALAAFQRRFRPERWDGLLDAETARRLAEVAGACDAANAAREAARRDRFRSYRRLN
jgi:N-acetylmuramoyl-L-alanine amidase